MLIPSTSDSQTATQDQQGNSSFEIIDIIDPSAETPGSPIEIVEVIPDSEFDDLGDHTGDASTSDDASGDAANVDATTSSLPDGTDTPGVNSENDGLGDPTDTSQLDFSGLRRTTFRLPSVQQPTMI